MGEPIHGPEGDVATRVEIAGQDTADPIEHGVARLWAEYKRTGERHLRDQLIVHYAPVVKYVAGRVSVGLPRHVDESDLASYGVIGLIDAIERFDPVRNVKFETYAIPRIKGAIIDELRSIDWVPRSVRSKARAVEQSFCKLEATLHRTPTDDEVAADRLEDQVARAVAQGGRIVTGGARTGNFFEPTVLVDIGPDNEAYRE